MWGNDVLWLYFLCLQAVHSWTDLYKCLVQCSDIFTTSSESFQAVTVSKIFFLWRAPLRLSPHTMFWLAESVNK